MKKITILGDIMNEPVMLNDAKMADGSYDYYPAFAPLKGLLDEADYRIANLETPLAGEEVLYSQNIFEFNTPDSMADALKKLGIDALSFANNHTFDRGQAGMLRTLKVLKEKGFAVTGAFEDPEKDRIAYFDLDGTRVAWIAYTLGTNARPESAEAEAQVNYLRRIGSPWMRPPFSEQFVKLRDLVVSWLGRGLTLVERVELCKVIGEAVAYGDECFDPLDSVAGMEKLQKDYEEARKNADIVLFYPHVGGQFNVKPGSFSKYIAAEAVKMGFDAILEAHSHTTQIAKIIDGKPVFYSLGNVSMTHTVYTVDESLPEYGIAAHLYVDGGKIMKTAFSLFKMWEREGHRMEIWPVDELLEKLTDEEEKAALLKDVAAVWARVSGKSEADFAMAREFELPM